MVPFGFKNSWHVWFHIFCGIEILELNGIDVDVETYIDLFLSDYIDFTKTGNVEQELPLQNGFLYTSGFSGETGSAPKNRGLGALIL